MEIKNFDEIIDKNRVSLINGFVSQYGPSFNENKFNKLKFCFFESPKLIQEYIAKKQKKLGIRYTFEFLNKMGADTEKVKLDPNDILTSDNPEVAKILHAFFPSKGYINEADFEQGIFAYGPKYQDNTEYNLLKKAIVLNKMGTLPNVNAIKTLIASPKYTKISEMMISLEQIARKFKDIISSEMQDLEKYREELNKKEKSIIDKYVREYIFSCLDFMPQRNRLSLTNYPDMDLSTLPNIEFFTEDNLKDSDSSFSLEELPLSPGLVEYFSKENTEKLLTSKDNNLRATIIAKRLEYLTKKGIVDLKVSKNELFYQDWYQITSLKDQLPNLNIVEKIKKRRLLAQQKCLNDIASSRVLNNYQITDLKVRDAILVGKNITHDENIVFAPLTKDYPYADINFDHLLRVALETTSEKKIINSSGYGLPIGSEIREVKEGISFYIEIGNKKIGNTNQNINNILTRKLAIEATKKRHQQGVFLFNSREDASYMNSSELDKFIPNFDAVFPKDIQNLLVASKIFPSTSLPVYTRVSQEMLTTINDVIMRLDPEVYNLLKSIGNSLAELGETVKNSPNVVVGTTISSNKM